jgi:hypothetical protein
MHIANGFLGYVAAFAVLATFVLKDMLRLRLMALASNVLFVAYAFIAGLESDPFVARSADSSQRDATCTVDTGKDSHAPPGAPV